MSTQLGKTSTSEAPFEAGCRSFEAVFGSPAQAFVEGVDALAPGFGRFIIETEFGAVYGRPGLSLGTRELVVIAACAALGETGLDAVRMHAAAALRAGVSRAAIVETLVQVSMAAGLPAALKALTAVAGVFAEHDAGPAQVESIRQEAR